MIDKISNKILNLLSNESQTEEQKEILLFGITRIIEDIPKTIGIVIIGLLLNIIKEMIIVTAVIALYKTFVGGVHAKTNWGCFFSTIVFYLATIYGAKYILLNGVSQYGIYILIYIFAIYSIFVYVPADVPEIPKVNNKLRKTLKIKSIISLNILYIITLIGVKDVIVQNLIIYSIFFINLMTIRIVYKIFKTEYGYETYIPDELI